MTSRRNERVMVALSGGVDSAVAAALLVDAGHEVEGVYVKTWEHETDVLGDCPGAQDLADAQDVAECLGIPFEVVNFVDFLSRERGPAHGGRLPKWDYSQSRRDLQPPDEVREIARARRRIEDSRLWPRVITAGGSSSKTARPSCGKVWTRTRTSPTSSPASCQKQLTAARFPLGEIPKPEVRRIAKERNIPVADKKDSQGIWLSR